MDGGIFEAEQNRELVVRIGYRYWDRREVTQSDGEPGAVRTAKVIENSTVDRGSPKRSQAYLSDGQFEMQGPLA